MTKRFYCLAFYVALALIGGRAAVAQPVEEEELTLVYGDKENVSIATGSKQPLRRAPSVATVITAEDIKAMGATDLDQVMETVPGVHVSRYVSEYSPNYQFRGITAPITNAQVLMLQNGVPMNSIYRGDRGQSWGGLPLENVERIEIIRGPGSALYGADAFSGVINIITKNAANITGTEFGLRGGSFNSRNGWVLHGGQWGELEVAAYANVGTTDGYKQIVTSDAATRFGTSLTPGPVNTGYDAVDAGLELGYQKWKLRTSYKLRNNVGIGIGQTSVLDPVGRERSERIIIDMAWDDANVARNWAAGVAASALSYSEDANHYQFYPPGTTFPTGTFPEGMMGSPGRWERQLRVSGYANYTGIAEHNIRLGLGHDDQDLYRVRTEKNFLLNPTPGPTIGVPIPSAYMDYSAIQPHTAPHRRFNDYVYAQDEWSFARDWTLTAGVRNDNYSDFGNTTNPRLALVWDVTSTVTAKLLYGEAFRAPAFGELYNINPVSNGNPDLKPERLKMTEAAFSWQARRDAQFTLGLFQYTMRDTIRAVANVVANTGTTYQNTGQIHGGGGELEALWDATSAMRLTGHYSYQQSIDDATGTDAGYAPHQHIHVRGDWQWALGWMSSLQANRVMDRRRAYGDARAQVPDYTTVDLTLRYSAGKRWEFGGGVLNAFDATVLEPSIAPGTAIPNDLPMAPRSMWLQVTYR